ncbi:MAG: hypothetical protein KKA05_09735 [Alphaproteobacteria bacterium]|nr:hypothetical protein [Alphaproteobacteria bacterium]
MMQTVQINRLSHSFATSYFDAQTAHDGLGKVLTSRVVPEPEWGCNFVDLVALLPEASIGIHEHGMDDSEIYIVISGEGEMTLAGGSIQGRSGLRPDQPARRQARPAQYRPESAEIGRIGHSRPTRKRT